MAIFTGGVEMGSGLTGLLAFIAGVTLAVTQHYPRAIFDFIMGMCRWSWRVVAYAALMRDEYPPFRLDTGPDEPGASVPSTPPPTVSPASSSTQPPLPA